MKTPLFFKLLLILALGFRLIRAAKKPKAVLPVALTLAPDPLAPEDLVLSEEDRPALEQIVFLYRQRVRQLTWETMTTTQQAICLLYTWSRQRESAFRFLWYRPEYALAWGDLLARMEWKEAADGWQAVLREVSGMDNPTAPHDWIPQGNTSYPALETFQSFIRSNSIYSKFIAYVFAV